MPLKIVGAMAIASSSPGEKSRNRRSRQATSLAEESRLRTIRIDKGLTQAALAEQAGMHRNSIRKLENGTTHEVTAENANALSEALKTSIADLGLKVRAATEARSIRIRRLSAEQRQIVDELLSLPPEDYAVIRTAIEQLRESRTKKPRRGSRR
ncbi:MAG TPA: helix-turn-helix transcriptional regulator [Thermoanaerobaculia bacterium]